MVFHTVQDLKESYARVLREQGKGVSLDTPVGEQGATIDILTDSEIVVCKLDLDSKSAMEAKSQLDFYGRFSPQWKKVVAVETISNGQVVKRLAASGIEVVPVLSSATRLVELPVEVPKFVYSSAYDYKTFEGGQGSVVALGAIAFIFLFGLAGFVASRPKQSDDSSTLLDAQRLLAAQYYSLQHSLLGFNLNSHLLPHHDLAVGDCAIDRCLVL